MNNNNALITIKKGLDIPLAGEPAQVIHEAPPVRSVAVLGRDYPGLRPSMEVEEGERVRLGQALFHDKRSPKVRFTAPGAGVVRKIHRGARRVLQSVVIDLEGEEQERFESYAPERLDSLGRDQVRANLLASGLWTALRTRPYSKVPRATRTPQAIFVTAVDTNPLAVDPQVVIREAGEDLANGLRVLARLTDGQVYVCTGPGDSPPLPEGEHIRHAQFAGPHPAGLPGTHIHFLHPVSAGRTVWYVGYQDVIAMGRLFTTGHLAVERVVSIAGPAVLEPRLVRTRLGASAEDLLRDGLRAGELRPVSGSALSGHRAVDWAAYLGRYHTQITVLEEGYHREFLGWLAPGLDKFSGTTAFLSSLFKGRRFDMNTSQNGSPRAMVPIGAYERVMPLDILPTQLLRALVVRDTDTAQALGALELDEEDLALCSFVCPGKYDYGPALRQSLNQIEREG